MHIDKRTHIIPHYRTYRQNYRRNCYSR